jgi:formate dehydrogenase beta subunit
MSGETFAAARTDGHRPIAPTDTGDPAYFHRVVDCRWACPAHTDVPGYVRLVAQGRYDDAYMLNRESNVFPGILGRVCDRPCEPACRRQRLDGEPVAICRLKRVAADQRGDITARLPAAPGRSNGKRVACVGAGPASLTVANDLRPLGYEVLVIEKAPQPGGLMRTNIPAFRLPAEVLDEEIGFVLGMGVDILYDTPVSSLKALLDAGYDAIFVGSGAPRGTDVDLPGRHEAEDRVHIGLEWLESIAFGHVHAVGPKVVVIGAGNTAMDCARSARRLGAGEVTVMARRPRAFFKASPWELEDAEAERIRIVAEHSPRRFVVEDGRLVGVEFDLVRWDETATHSEVVGTEIVPCDDVILALGQERAFPWIERGIGMDFDDSGMPVVDPVTMESTLAGVFIGGDAAWGAKNIVSAVAHGHEAAISIHAHCRGESAGERPPLGMKMVSLKMGLGQWGYHNDYDPASRQAMAYLGLAERFAKLDLEVEQGFSVEQALVEAQRCLNCDVQTVFRPSLCIECDACIDVCPVGCLTLVAATGDEASLRTRLSAPATNPDEPLYISAPLAHTGRSMVKDENICAHCGLCAERCPTSAWDMEQLDLSFAHAGGAGGGFRP